MWRTSVNSPAWLSPSSAQDLRWLATARLKKTDATNLTKPVSRRSLPVF
jgi:hypothetical protein